MVLLPDPRTARARGYAELRSRGPTSGYAAILAADAAGGNDELIKAARKPVIRRIYSPNGTDFLQVRRHHLTPAACEMTRAGRAPTDPESTDRLVPELPGPLASGARQRICPQARRTIGLGATHQVTRPWACPTSPHWPLRAVWPGARRVTTPRAHPTFRPWALRAVWPRTHQVTLPWACLTCNGAVWPMLTGAARLGFARISAPGRVRAVRPGGHRVPRPGLARLTAPGRCGPCGLGRSPHHRALSSPGRSARGAADPAALRHRTAASRAWPAVGLWALRAARPGAHRVTSPRARRVLTSGAADQRPLPRLAEAVGPREPLNQGRLRPAPPGPAAARPGHRLGGAVGQRP
ncbi:hypothetical protein QBC98_005347 [Kitasatospora acidiphila]